nr:hypothetical protein [uncultured bacterium]
MGGIRLLRTSIVGSLFFLLLLFNSFFSLAQQEKDSLVLTERSGGPWKHERDTIKLMKQTFDVRYGNDIYFTGQIHLEPMVIFHNSPEGRRFNLKPNVTATIVEDKPLGNRLWLTYRLARQHLDYPNQHLEYVRVYYNNGESYDYQRNMLIPEDVSKISSIEIKWKGNELPVTRVLIWGEIGAPLNRLWYLFAATLVIGGGVTYIRRRRKRPKVKRPEKKKEEEEEKEEDKKVTITITQIDPELVVESLRPYNLIRVKAIFMEKPKENVTASLDSIFGGKLELDLEPLSSPNTYISETFLLNMDGLKSEYNALSLKVGNKDSISITIGETTTFFPLSLQSLPDVPDLPGIRITRNGPLEITVDPQAGINGELNVRVIDEFDYPIPNIRVVWDVKGFQEDMPCTVTDEDGITKLGFVPISTGGFDPVDSDLPISSSLKSQMYKIKPILEDSKLLELVSEDTPEFKVDLVAPTFLRILNHNYQESAYLVKGENTFFQVTPGRADAQGLGSTLEVTVIDPDDEEETLELRESPKKGTYENIDPWSAEHDDDGEKVVLRFNNRKTSVPVYETEYKGQDSQLYPTLNLLKQINLQVRRSNELTKEQQTELHLKAKMIANAIIWLDEPSGIYQIPINSTGKYLELLELPLSELGPMKEIKVDPEEMPGTLKKTKIVYACQKEADEITETIQRAANRFDNNVTWTCFKTIVEIVAAPHIGAYTAYTGRTIEGKKVGTLERFVGGVTAMTGLIPVGGAFVRYARAARAMERHALSHLNWYATTMEKAYTVRLFAIKAAASQQLRIQLASLFKKTIKEEQRIQKQAQKTLDDVDKLQSKIRTLEDDIMTTKNKLDSEIARRADDPFLKPVTKEMESWGRGIKRREMSLSLRRKELKRAKVKHQLQVERLDDLYLGRELNKKELLRLHEERLLPAHNDKFGGRRSTDLYQGQVEGDLAATGAAWKGVTKRKIHTPYRQTRWGTDFKVAKKKTIAPEADHLHVNGLQGADSKFWTFWPDEVGDGLTNILKGRDTITHRVRQAVNSIEKGRQIQYNMLVKDSGQKGMLVWEKVWDLDFYIITPIKVPEHVQNIIKASVGGAGRKIKFKVVPARLDDWAKAIPN